MYTPPADMMIKCLIHSEKQANLPVVVGKS
jgi:hypothetical protein